LLPNDVESTPEKQLEPTPTPAPAPTPTPTPTQPPDAYPKLVLSLAGATETLRSYWRLAEPVGALPAADSEPTQPQPGAYRGNPGFNAGGVLKLGSDISDVAVDLNGTDAFVEVPFN